VTLILPGSMLLTFAAVGVFPNVHLKDGRGSPTSSPSHDVTRVLGTHRGSVASAGALVVQAGLMPHRPAAVAAPRSSPLRPGDLQRTRVHPEPTPRPLRTRTRRRARPPARGIFTELAPAI
jgi:hypothetical protein